jgi:putative NADH-flavin reductase
VKTALLFGASGLVGNHLLNQLISNNNYSNIKLFVRSSIDISDPKIEIIQTDFNNLENHKEDIKGDDCFFCIGTTKQNSPDKNEYRRVELEVPKQIAQIAKSNSVNSFVICLIWLCRSKKFRRLFKIQGRGRRRIKKT